MIRFAFTFALFLVVVGCQSAAHGPKSSMLVQTPKPATPAQKLWHTTAKIFSPLMPDTGKRSTGTENHFAVNRTGSDILPINHTSHSLYKPGSILPLPFLAPSKEETHSLVAEAETSESLPSEAAPLPDETLVAEKRPAVKIPVKKRGIEPEDDEDDFDFDEEPPVRQVARKSLTRLDDSVVAKTTAPAAAPVYPTLPQLSGVAPVIQQASYQQSLPPYSQQVSGYGAGDWQTPMRTTIEQLRYAIEQTPNGKSLSNEMRLRMLEMLLGNKAEAAKPMLSADKTVNAFMGNQILGFAALLDDSMSDNRGKYISAAYRFNEGLSELQRLCPIKLNNVTFVREWFGYGQFVAHPGEFHPGDEFQVYIEIENPVVRPADGFEVSVAISYEIRDIHANIVVKQDAGRPAERTLSRKRDYCLAIPGVLPTSLAPGQYQLRLNVTDLNDDLMQYAEEQIPLKVVPSLAGESALSTRHTPSVPNYARQDSNL